jgi:hypothetical protein
MTEERKTNWGKDCCDINGFSPPFYDRKEGYNKLFYNENKIKISNILHEETYKKWKSLK